MSSLKNLRQRFSKETKDGMKSGHSPCPLEEDIFELIEPSEEIKFGAAALAAAEDTQSCSSFPSEDLMSSLKWQSPDDRRMFEEQLFQLQEQLMMVMIENQTLKSELSSSKTKIELEQTKAELEYERHRGEVLEKKLEQGLLKKAQKVHRSHSDLTGKNKASLASSSGSTSSAFSDLDDGTDAIPLDIRPPVKKRFYQRIVEWFMRCLYTFLDDFTEEPPPTTAGDPEGDPLTVKTLKENIKRFGTEARPYMNTVKGIYDLLAWKSPPYTLIVFVVYMYSMWQGWFLPMLLFSLSFRMFINYLRYRGWNVSFNFFETVEETKNCSTLNYSSSGNSPPVSTQEGATMSIPEVEKIFLCGDNTNFAEHMTAIEVEEKDLGMSDKFNLVMQVARKVQNFLGEVADSLEKVKSLLTWRHPEASRQLFLTISAAFITSCIMPTSMLFFYAGLGFGIKLFIIDYVYNRFPRVRRKYDSSWRLWMELPTDTQYEKQNAKSEIDKYILPHSQEKGEVAAEAKSDHLSLDDRTFCELFALPESECPLPGWHGGRRCTLINREKSLTAAFKNGKLYLTHSFLCFERTKVPSPKNIVIPLADIARLEKAKPYGWMPGGGMAIEIAVVGNDKTFLFGGLMNRDEVYDIICFQGYKKLEEACLDDKLLPWILNQEHFRKQAGTKRFQHFTLASVYKDSD